MEQVNLEVQVRTEVGRTANHRLRAKGMIPSIVYSHGSPSIPVAVSEREFVRIASAVRSSQVFTLKSPNKDLDGKSAVVKEVQRDHLQGTLLHVDFQAIREDEELTVKVPLRMVGEAPGVKVDGGILTVVARELTVRCFPKLIPAEIDVDVSELHLGDSIHADKVKLPKGVTLAGNPGETIVSVVTVRFVEEETTTAAAAAVEGAEGVPVEGAAAAPGAAPGTVAPTAEGAAAAAAPGAAGKEAAPAAKDAKGAAKEGKKEAKK
jgi:large subunit ribosomal protein L25